MTRTLPALLAATISAVPALAQAPASGTFSSRGVSFKVAGGVAFPGRSSLDGQTPVVIVAISNTGLNAEAIGDFVDRKRAIERLVKDDETPVVYFEFTPQGRWKGLSYYLASGNGCGFCTSEVTSTVTLAGGRLKGAVKGTEQDRPFDVALDAAILSDDHGAALPAGGGAPGTAYLAYHAALAKKDAAAVEPLLSPGNREVFARAKKNSDVDGYLAYLAEKHQLTAVTISKGWATTAKASLLVEGISALGKVAGEVLLVSTGGAWGVDEELMDLVIGQ
jgi:hypothetical protein